MADWQKSTEAPEGAGQGLHTWHGLDFASKAMRLDAGETNIISQQLEQMESTVYADIYPEIRTPLIVPFDVSGDPGAEFHTWRTSDANVEWKLMSDDGMGQDAPSQSMQHNKETAQYYSFFHAFGYSLTDVRRAQMANIPLSTEQPRIAREGWERLLENIAATGYTGTNLGGVLTNSDVPIETESTPWATLQATSSLTLLNRMLAIQAEYREANRGAGELEFNTLVLPLSTYHLVKHSVMSADNTQSVLEAFLAKQEVPNFTVTWWDKTINASAGGSTNRALLYRRDPNILSLKMSVPFEMLPVQPRNLSFQVPCHARTAGVIIKRPLGLLYIDDL